MACAFWPLHSSWAYSFPKTYDQEIKKAAEMWLPGIPWKLLKAQYWQESRLNPNARSPVGAEGIAQFMPATAKEIWPLLGYSIIDRRAIEPAINAGAYYMARLRKSWSSPRPWEDRHKLALASYNAGLGNILRSQKACNMPILYDPIMSCLPKITGQHAKETLGYAPIIWKFWKQMEVM
jgi:soluble lytic murein transglycosylase-like protein